MAWPFPFSAPCFSFDGGSGLCLIRTSHPSGSRSGWRQTCGVSLAWLCASPVVDKMRAPSFWQQLERLSILTPGPQQTGPRKSSVPCHVHLGSLQYGGLLRPNPLGSWQRQISGESSSACGDVSWHGAGYQSVEVVMSQLLAPAYRPSQLTNKTALPP